VDCQLTTLRGKRSLGAVIAALSQLPKGLEETYDRILQNIPDDDQKVALRVLQLLVVAYVPLGVEDIAMAVTVDCEGQRVDPNLKLRDPYDILEICPSLVELYRFFCFSVKLISPEMKNSQGYGLLTFPSRNISSRMALQSECRPSQFMNLMHTKLQQPSPLYICCGKAKMLAQNWYVADFCFMPRDFGQDMSTPVQIKDAKCWSSLY